MDTVAVIKIPPCAFCTFEKSRLNFFCRHGDLLLSLRKMYFRIKGFIADLNQKSMSSSLRHLFLLIMPFLNASTPPLWTWSVWYQ